MNKSSNNLCIVRNPASEQIIAEYSYLTPDEIYQKIDTTQQIWQKWRYTDWNTRNACAKQLAVLLRNNSSEYAHLITHEMGKPIVQAEQEIEKCAWLCDYYAEHAENYLRRHPIATERQRSYVIYQPLGVVLGVMPWNFPFWQVMRFAIPTLLAGNAIVLKHASNVTGCSLALESLFLSAGFPEHLLTSLVMNVEHIPQVIHHPHIRAASVTGSDHTGSIIAAEAGKALKKTVLELGGSDPYIVLADADLDLTAQAIITSRFNNAGQSCIAAKRILAVDEVRDELQKRVVFLAKEYTYHDPTHRRTKLGPLARRDLRENLHRQVTDTVVQGAHLECGGFLPECMGYYYPATVLTDVPVDTAAYNEELFGPVISFIPVKDEVQAVQVANQTHFGLSSGVFSRDIERAEHIAQYLMAGSVSINQFTVSDPRLPFGGIKNSGYGRELSAEGIREFTNIKTIVVA